MAILNSQEYSDESNIVPHLSERSTEFILNDIDRDYDLIIEYGSGGSTRFFLRKLLEKKIMCSFISIEIDSMLFKRNCEIIKSVFTGDSLSNERIVKNFWTNKRIKEYIDGESNSQLDIPIDLRRLPLAQKRLKKTFLGIRLNSFFKKMRPFDSTFSVTISDKIQFIYELRMEFMKDQYGESPNKKNYIDAGLNYVNEELKMKNIVKALFMIDGGPRGDILHSILDLEERNPHFFPTIYLFEAQRILYSNAIKRRKSGQFIEGNNKMISGGVVYSVKDKAKMTETDKQKYRFFYGKEFMTAEEMSQKEMWFYSRQK